MENSLVQSRPPAWDVTSGEVGIALDKFLVRYDERESSALFCRLALNAQKYLGRWVGEVSKYFLFSNSVICT
jgi:hypothetical protein